MKKQSELLRALRNELAATEKELADQKWAFEQILNSRTWRWTAPVRRAVNQLRRLQNGHAETEVQVPLPEPTQVTTDNADSEEPDSTEDVKAWFTSLCRVELESFLAAGTILELPQSSNPAISIVLVLFNRAELTLACLRSIAESDWRDLEVVIVDNASSDETPQLLQRLKDARIFRNSENLHFLAAAKQGARECCGENILFLNNDAQLLPGALRSALNTIRASSDIGAVGGKIILLDGSLQEAGNIIWQDGSCTGYGRGDDPMAPMYNFRRDVDYCSAVFLLTPRRVWEEMGGFDHTFEPEYYEETEYCMRLWQRGLRVAYEPDAAILHYEFASWGSVSDAMALQATHQTVFAERYGSLLAERTMPSSEALLHARARNASRRTLFLDDRVPHLWLGSGFPRANALIRALHRLGYFVTLFPLDVLSEPWESAYSDLPREIEMMMGLGRDMLQPLLRSRKDYYSAIIVSRPHNMKLLVPILAAHPDWFENIEVIYDAEALFAAREIGLRKLAGNPMTNEEIHASFASEIRLAAAADRVICISENERKAFLSHGIKQVEVLGHSIDAAPGAAAFGSREGFLFVGAVHEEQSPNADSLIWFLSEIYPRIRNKLGDVPLTIAGVNQSARICEMARPPVRLTGHLPSLEDLYNKAKVFVAPTRYAAGVPHKVHEAAAHGLPVVATPLLAQQLDWTDRELAIAEDAEAFAAQCIETYTDAAKWTNLRESALERVQTECSPKMFEERVRQILSG
jgi:O-antigen biosynthesis protein